MTSQLNDDITAERNSTAKDDITGEDLLLISVQVKPNLAYIYIYIYNGS